MEKMYRFGVFFAKPVQVAWMTPARGHGALAQIEWICRSTTRAVSWPNVLDRLGHDLFLIQIDRAKGYYPMVLVKSAHNAQGKPLYKCSWSLFRVFRCIAFP